MAKPLVKAFYEKGGVLLLWPLGSELQIGSVGYFSKGQWIALGTTRELFAIKLRVPPIGRQRNSYDASGGRRFQFKTYGKGQVSALTPDVADAHARAEIIFGTADSFVMSVKNQRIQGAQGLGELMAAIRYSYRYGLGGFKWERHYAVIVGIASADSVAALTASKSGSSAIVSARATSVAPSTPASLDASMTVTSSNTSVEKIWVQNSRGYAVRALKIKPSLFTRWDREDFEYVMSRALAIRDATAKSDTPTSYRSWARRAKVSLSADDAVPLTLEDADLDAAGKPGKLPRAKTRSKKAARKRRA